MKKINFLFGIHCHQPVGNFEHVMEESYQNCYHPFLSLVSEYPSIRITIHFTGILLDWFSEKRPEFIGLIKKLVSRGQIEIMTGGFYEPILAVISSNDRIGQIKKLTKFIRDKFSYEPSGMWVAERIWEPHLAKDICSSGVKYIPLDDYHFLSTGLMEKDLYGYYVTEEQASTVCVFPISKILRYLIPFKYPDETIAYLKSIATEEGDRAAIIADDGEKFGVWPGTYKWVYDEKWLRNFFDLLVKNQDWINICTFADYMAEHKPINRIYLPTASYFEMSEWSLPPHAASSLSDMHNFLKANHKLSEWQRFIKGGFWRNFLVKYPESNNMHKKMFYLSTKADGFPASEKLEKARDHIWKAQCNCAYWHGVFGGLYLNYLRYAIYENLIAAESILDESNGKQVELYDINKDGLDEILIRNKYLTLYISPSYGGSIFEFDYKEKLFNLGNTLARRPESYHNKLLQNQLSNQDSYNTASIHDELRVKEEGLEKFLKFDKYNRYSLLDHFLPAHVKPEQMAASHYEEISGFAGCNYDFSIKESGGKKAVILKRRSGVFDLEKTLLVDDKKIVVEYKIINTGTERVETIFGTEFNLGFLCGNSRENYYEGHGISSNNNLLNSIGISDSSQEFKIVDKWKGFSIIFMLSVSGKIWRFPVETVSQSEAGLERTYQNCSVFPNWRLDLAPGEIWNVRLVVALANI